MDAAIKTCMLALTLQYWPSALQAIVSYRQEHNKALLLHGGFENTRYQSEILQVTLPSYAH